MGSFGITLAGAASAITTVLDSDLFEEDARGRWAHQRQSRMLPAEATSTHRLTVETEGGSDADEVVGNAAAKLAAAEASLADRLAACELHRIVLELAWEIPGDGFVRALALPEELTRICGRLGIAITINAHAVEGRAFEG